MSIIFRVGFNNGIKADQMENRKTAKSYFIKGPINPLFIAEEIANHSNKTNIGGHAIFLGQIRADKKSEKIVAKIEYSAYEGIANKEISKIREGAFSKHDLSCLHIYHSIGDVAIGEISLFVFVSSTHRKDAIDAMTEIVEKIKYDVPIWKKEIMIDKSCQWVD